MQTDRIAVFDVCGTITRTNNTFAFIRFVLREDGPFRYGLLMLVRLLAALIAPFKGPGFSGKDRLRDAQIALLRGYSPARLSEMAERYVDELFANRLLNQRILEAMQRERCEGRTVVLTSAAIDPPVAALAQRLEVENCFCSELEIRDGRCTGRLRSDLRGRKDSTLEDLPETWDSANSRAYSDNLEDVTFLERFGRGTVVLNDATAMHRWAGYNGKFDYLVNYEKAVDKDVNSVNERTIRWVYLPSIYYIVSRFHRTGLRTLLLREVVPATLAAWLFTSVGAFAFVLMPLSFLMFYAVYEIGGLFNDLLARREAPEQATHRIASNVRVRVGPFLAVRAAVIGLLLAWLPLSIEAIWLYLGALGICLTIYVVHTLILSQARILTFALLKICRNSIPLLVLASSVSPVMLLTLSGAFSAVDAPWRVYAYGVRHGQMKETIPVRHVRFFNVAVVAVVGAIVWLAGGPACVAAIASYYVAIDVFWFVRGK